MCWPFVEDVKKHTFVLRAGEEKLSYKAICIWMTCKASSNSLRYVYLANLFWTSAKIEGSTLWPIENCKNMKLVDNLVKFANETSIGGLIQIAKSSSSKTCYSIFHTEVGRLFTYSHFYNRCKFNLHYSKAKTFYQHISEVQSRAKFYQSIARAKCRFKNTRGIEYWITSWS